ncbi:hypothetical protein [Puia sp.]|jgi:hypothetical protein|uniref:hypothetical protein n=1 Tax=Puia sp. TaxID=2045100 RepID=UPI002F40CBB6
MIQFHELRMGDLVLVEFDGQKTEGEVIDLDGAERKIQVRTGDGQDFWYSPNDLYPIMLNEDQLLKFGFEKQVQADGKIKYLKGPFRILSGNGNFSDFEMWYREDRRHITRPLSVHGLQNHFHQMTKIDLTRAVQEH